MAQILDSKGQPTTLKAGNCIGFHVEHHCLVLMERSGDGTHMKWTNDDDKKIANFIRTENDFRQFAEILAETHGLSIREDWRCSYGPAYVFV